MELNSKKGMSSDKIIVIIASLVTLIVLSTIGIKSMTSRATYSARGDGYNEGDQYTDYNGNCRVVGSSGVQDPDGTDGTADAACGGGGGNGVNWNGVINIAECAMNDSSNCFIFMVYKYDPADEDDTSAFAMLFGANQESLVTYTNYCKITSGKLSATCEGAIRAIGGDNWRRGLQLDPSATTYDVNDVLSLSYKQWNVPIIGDLPSYTLRAVEKPTDAYCRSGLKYNGTSQVLTRNSVTGVTFVNNTGTNAGEYTVTAKLQNGYVWTDNSTGNVTIKCRIEAGDNPVDKPTAATYCKTGLKYNGSEQTLTNNPATGYTFSGNKGTNAGEYTVTATLQSGYVWSDNSTGNVTFKCNIEAGDTPVLKPTAATYCKTGLKYNGSEQTLTNDPATGYTFSGNKGTNAGEYTVTATLQNGYVWTDNSKDEVTFKCNIEAGDTPVDKPTADTFCNSALTYNGNEQTLTKAAHAGYTFSGNKGTNAGEYTVTATLQNGYIWSDNTTGNATFKCSINKATPVIELDSTNGSVLVDGTVKFKEKADTDGIFNNVSNDPDKATVVPDTTSEIPKNEYNDVTVTGVSEGNTTITVTFTPTDQDNYNSITSISDGGRIYNVVVGNVQPSLNEVEIPTSAKYCKTGLVYNSQEQILTKDPAIGSIFTNNKGTNAGTYKILATLQSGYMWTNGETSDVTFECEIGKATPIVTADPDNITMLVGDNNIIIPDANIDGTYTAISDDPSIAKPTIKGDKDVIIEGISPGDTIVRIKFTPKDTDNYEEVIIPIKVKVKSNSIDDIVNPQTGSMAIIFAWIVGISAICYAFWYYKKINN